MTLDRWCDHDLSFAIKLGTPAGPDSTWRTIQIAAERAGHAGVVNALRKSAAVAGLGSGGHTQPVADAPDRIRCEGRRARPELGPPGPMDPRPGRRWACQSIRQSGTGIFGFTAQDARLSWRCAWSR
jgi:hypothetical protein